MIKFYEITNMSLVINSKTTKIGLIHGGELVFASFDLYAVYKEMAKRLKTPAGKDIPPDMRKKFLAVVAGLAPTFH